jgi:hypothetical protein
MTERFELVTEIDSPQRYLAMSVSGRVTSGKVRDVVQRAEKRREWTGEDSVFVRM